MSGTQKVPHRALITLCVMMGNLMQSLDASIANIWYAVQALGLSLKKKRSGRPSGTGPTS